MFKGEGDSCPQLPLAILIPGATHSVQPTLGVLPLEAGPELWFEGERADAGIFPGPTPPALHALSLCLVPFALLAPVCMPQSNQLLLSLRTTFRHSVSCLRKSSRVKLFADKEILFKFY